MLFKSESNLLDYKKYWILNIFYSVQIQIDSDY